MITYLYKVCLSILFFPFFVSAQIVFSEVMYNVQGADYQDEYIELFNLSSAQAVDLSGWTFSDSSGTDILVSAGAGIILAPRQFAVILDGSYFENSSRYDDVIPESALIIKIDNNSFGSNGLSNSKAETLLLMNSAGDTVQIYRYSTGNEEGYPDEKILLNGGNGTENWADGLVSGGTPGFRNSVTPWDYDLTISKEAVNYHPSIMIKTGNTVHFSAAVQNSGMQVFDDSIRVRLFADMNDGSEKEPAREIANRVIQTSLPSSESIVFEFDWAPERAGIYQIALQIESDSDQNQLNNRALVSLVVYESEETVAINEIKFLTAEDEPEWIELYNYGSKPLNLFGWGIADAVDTCRLDSLIYLLPDQYKIFTADSGLEQFYSFEDSLLIIVNGFPTLNNNGDVLYLLNPGGGWVEQVPYEKNWLEGEEWRIPSLERINPLLDCRRSENWGPCTDAKSATPGVQNALFTAIERNSDLKVFCNPDPFSPDGDGYEDYTIIQLQSPLHSGRLRIQIFDINGHRVRTICDNVFAGSSYSVPWDGKNDAGLRLRMGIYIILAQVLDDRSGIFEEYKKTVVLAARM